MLTQYGGLMPEKQAARLVMMPLLKALDYMHKSDVVHRSGCDLFGVTSECVVGHGRATSRAGL